MPNIIIKTCTRTPNYDALEAVAKCMRLNYLRREKVSPRQVRVESKRTIQVTELPASESDSLCSCSFEVVLV